MYGFVAALGVPADSRAKDAWLSAWPTASPGETVAAADGVTLARFWPATGGDAPGFVRSDDGQVLVYVDGYLYTAEAPREAGRGEQVRAFANHCAREGFEVAWRGIEGGTFNAVVVDRQRRTTHVTTDAVGSLPLYVSHVEGGALVSNNPVALLNSGLVDRRPDFTAMAEWAYIGYTLGDRFLHKGIRIVSPCTSVFWEQGGSRAHLRENAGSPWRELPGPGPGPDADELAEAFIEACQRISLLDPAPVQFQSAGKDSRLILAAWPAGTNPPCYTYGDASSHEVTLARELAELRGSSWQHVWLDGDAMAPVLPKLYECTGLFVYPDRYFTSRTIRADGHRGALDGYLGGVTIGAGFLEADKYFSRLTRFLRLLTVYRDQKVSAIGLDAITDAILDSILDVRDEASFRQFLREDFIDALRDQRAAIRDDLAEQVRRFLPANDSLGALWNNVVLANRSVHSICQQMVIVRSHLDVYCPFSGDVHLARLQWRLKPQAAAYKRLYIDMYRRHFRPYGELPYGATLLPLTRPAIQHKLAAILMSRGIILPPLTGDPRGRPRDATGWATWLRQSGPVRETARDLLREGDILDEARTAATFQAVAAGTRRATGKVFHYAAISRWLAQSA